MAVKKVASKGKAEKKAPRVKGKPKVLYFGGAKLDLLERIQSRAKREDKGFNEVVFDALEKGL